MTSPVVEVSTTTFDQAGLGLVIQLERAGYTVRLNPYGRKMTEDEIAAALNGNVIGLIAGTEPLTRRVLADARALRVVVRCGAGVDTVDVEAARELGIVVHNTPEPTIPAVSELTICLALAVLRRVAEADRNLRAGKWAPLMGHLLSERHVGLVGFGRIGRRAAQLFRAFGARVWVSDRIPDLEFAARIGAEVVSTDVIVENCDLISLHVPHEPSTHHIIDRQFITRMRRGTIVMNVCRGGLVDEEALYDALVSGHLAGAALDTFEREPYAGPLRDLPQVVLTMHMGSYALEARMRMEEQSVQKLLQALQEIAGEGGR